jgi:hypothetical protein
MDMKLFLVMPFVLLLGLIIGGWAPKQELAAVTREVDELRKKVSAGEKGTRLGDFTRMAQIPERAKNVRKSDDRQVKPAESGSATNALTTTVRAASTNPHPAAAEAPVQSPEDLRVRIEEAKELWKTRVDLARAQWLDRLKLSPEQTELFDTAINTMNERLFFAMQDLADTMEKADSLTPEIGTRAFNEMTAALTAAYDDLHACVPEEQSQEIGNIDLPDFIDPGVAEPLIAVQDKIDSATRNNPRRRGPGFFR